MGAQADAYDRALARAAHHARTWLASVADRPVPAAIDADALGERHPPLPEGGLDDVAVVDELAALVTPGLTAIGSGRFFGWVMGGTLPSALAADWLTSAWDQNAGLRFATPGVVAAEEAAGRWLLQLLGLPPTADVGFVTGATMANFTGLAAGRHAVLAAAGWDVESAGLTGAPRIRVLVGAERHDTIDLALRYLGLGAPTVVPADEQGRIRVDALRDVLADGDGPAIVCLQAGNLHSGAFDAFGEAIPVAHQHDAWVHVDGAFGLWAAASPRLQPLVAGVAAADSWATDAHKTLNVPYDSGIAIVRDAAALRAALGVHTNYLPTGALAEPLEKVPELSRRARGLTVWAALRSLGRSGVAALVERLAARAAELAAGVATIDGVTVLNDVAYTQVCVSVGDEEQTRRAESVLLAGGVALMTRSRWHDRPVLRISVSNWSTDDDDVRRSVSALHAAVAEARAAD